MREPGRGERAFPKVLLGVAIGVLIESVLILAFYALVGGGPLISGPITAKDEAGVLGIGLMRAVVPLSVLACALWVIVSKRYPPSDRKWAYGAIAAIMAFWLAAGSL
jgi:hypothetical protein